MRRFLIGFLLLPAAAYGLGYEEFHLFGLDRHEAEIQLRISTEDDDSPIREGKNIVGVRATFQGERFGRGKGERLPMAGHCALRFEDPVILECGKGQGLLSGASYKGRKIDNESVKNFPKIKPVFDRYLKRNKYGGLGSYYECVRNCGPNVPDVLILVWHGD